MSNKAEDCAWLIRDAQRLMDQLRKQHAHIGMPDIHYGQAMNGVAMVLRALNAIGAPLATGSDGRGPLSDFFTWPHRDSPCPKCGREKRRFLDYQPSTSTEPERMKHVCWCGYFIYTKPVDASDDVFTPENGHDE